MSIWSIFKSLGKGTKIKYENEMLKYQEQNSELTLQLGLEEFYSANEQFKKLSESEGREGLFFQHDVTHILFGMNSTFEEEHLLDSWTLWGCKFKWKKIWGYFKHPAIKEVSKSIYNKFGAWGLAKKIIIMIPLKLLVVLRAIRMKKKWDYHNVTNELLNSKLCDLRREYNIKVYHPYNH